MAIKRLDDDDCALLDRTGHGDQQALASLYDRHAGIVYSIALRLLGDPSRAEMVLSDIFLEIWRNPGRFMPIAHSLSPSIAMIARNWASAVLDNMPVPAIDFASPRSFASLQSLPITCEEAALAIEQLPIERRNRIERVWFHDSAQAEAVGHATSPREEGEPLPMSETISQLAGSGIDVIDLAGDPAFAHRRLHARDVVAHVDGMNRLARVFAESPTRILHELVAAAVDLCGADSAGISIEIEHGSNDNFYHWAATAGQYSGFVDAKLPRYPSACGVTLERGRPQIFRVAQCFFDKMGVKAPTVTDGLLLPWQTEQTRGTIWIMAHGREEAFDGEDCRMMQALANFAATGVRLEQQQKLLMEQARIAAKAAMAHRLAHQINNPLQGLMQTVFLFGRGDPESSVFAQQAIGEVSKLSDLVQRLLVSPD